MARSKEDIRAEIMARAILLQAEVAGMDADNAVREKQGEALAYTAVNFEGASLRSGLFELLSELREPDPEQTVLAEALDKTIRQGLTDWWFDEFRKFKRYWEKMAGIKGEGKTLMQLSAEIAKRFLTEITSETGEKILCPSCGIIKGREDDCVNCGCPKESNRISQLSSPATEVSSVEEGLNTWIKALALAKERTAQDDALPPLRPVLVVAVTEEQQSRIVSKGHADPLRIKALVESMGLEMPPTPDDFLGGIFYLCDKCGTRQMHLFDFGKQWNKKDLVFRCANCHREDTAAIESMDLRECYAGN